jgi:hypothetical protein
MKVVRELFALRTIIIVDSVTAIHLSKIVDMRDHPRE